MISLDAVDNLTSVTTLVILLSSLDDPKFHPLKRAILDNRWTTFACSLRHLSLDSPLEDLEDIIPRDIKLVHLERFDLNIKILYRTSDAEALMCKIILPFLTSHTDTLETLVLDAEENFNLSSFLMKVPHIPRLSSFRLRQVFSGLDFTKLSGHHHFLQTNQAHLRDLDMSFPTWYPTVEVWFMQAWCRVRLPQLRSLTLFLPNFPGQDATAAMPYLVQYSRTLTALSLKTCRFSYEVASILLSQLGAVRTLELYVWAMSPDLLQQFVIHIPKLHSLKLNANYYSLEKDTQVRETDCIREVSG
jgi:hypothetical protein